MLSKRTQLAVARLADLTPKQIVAELDRYIVGQKDAKKSVAIALRNRWRRQQAPDAIRDEISPNNIILIGPTGVGKTEIARRLAKFAGAPFIKVEASKFTEVGYVGRDVESMVRDLVDSAIDMVRTERETEVEDLAHEKVEERLLDLLLPVPQESKQPAAKPEQAAAAGGSPTLFVVSASGEVQSEQDDGAKERYRRTREKIRQQLRDGALDDRSVEIEVKQDAMPAFRVFGQSGLEEMDVSLRESLSGLFGGRTRRRRVSVREAREILLRAEEERLVDPDAVKRVALQRVEESGIVFIDEIDKVAGRERGQGPDISREGVQRDLLPLVEGTTVNTRHGLVRTDHILFVASGAFHVSKPADLIPELQGRFPIRVELQSLGTDEFVRILTEPKNALVSQYRALLLTEGIEIDFTPDAVRAVAELAAHVNQRSENIGARRLHTIMEKLLDTISFDAPDMAERKVVIDRPYVQRMLADIVKDEDLSRYIL